MNFVRSVSSSGLFGEPSAYESRTKRKVADGLESLRVESLVEKLQHEMLPSKSHGFVMSSCSGILSVGTRLVNCVSFLGHHLVGGI